MLSPSIYTINIQEIIQGGGGYSSINVDRTAHVYMELYRGTGSCKQYTLYIQGSIQGDEILTSI